MATTQNGNGKGNGNGHKGNGDHIIGNEALKTMEQTGQPPAASRSQEAKMDKRFLQVSDQSCVTKLEQALGFGKAALNLECAVSLALFTFSNKGADLPTKRHAMKLYGEAGFNVHPQGEDYKTINRRVNAFAKLYESYERQYWIEAMEQQTEEEALEALKNYLTTEFAFRGINDILKEADVPARAYTRTAQPDRATPEQTDDGGVAQDTTDLDEPIATSTLAGGGMGEAAPQGTSGEGGLTEHGQAITKEGEIDKRTKPKDDPEATSEGVMTRMENNPNPLDKLSDKMPEGASAEDTATATKLSERVEQNRRAADKPLAPEQMKRRKDDSPDAIVFRTENIHVALPRDISADEVKEIALQLLAFAAERDSQQETSEKKPTRQSNRQQTTH